MRKKKLNAGRETIGTIDWNDVHHRMEIAMAAIGRALSPEEKKRVLKARAFSLAQDLGKEKPSGEKIDVLEFFLANESYGVETVFVREVYLLKELTPLPGTPSFVLGITNVRGEIISVVDIKKFFGLPEIELTEHSKVIIVRNEAMEFGILADDILGVRSIPLDVMQPSLPTLTGVCAEYLKGVTNGRIVILDVGKILSDRKIVVNEEVES